MKEKKIQYNPEQKTAINSNEEKIVIIAPPGSGKTHTMVGAITKYYEDNNGELDITAITFTRKAAAELTSYFFNTSKIHTSTIHSWSYKQLSILSEKHSFRVRLLNEEQIISILRPFMRQYGLVEQYNKWKLFHFVMGNYNIDVDKKVKKKYEVIAKRYIDFKRSRSLYDFTDLPLYLHDVLNAYDEYIQVGGLFVDEFQDVDPTQLKVFDRVQSKKKFFIGDPDQAIYIFRGASAEIFDSLKGYTIYPLKHNYRSYQTVLDFATTFKEQAERMTGIGLSYKMEYIEFINKSNIIADRGRGGLVLLDNSSLKLDFVKNKVGKPSIIKKEMKNNKYQILCRTNKQVKKFEELGYDMVSTIHKAKGLEFDNVIIVSFDVETQEDINVAYVALTRAKNREIIVNFEDLKEIIMTLPEENKNNKPKMAF